MYYAVSLGGANLYVNVSIELTNEMFHSELLQSGSELYNNKTSFLETQVSSCQKSLLCCREVIL